MMRGWAERQLGKAQSRKGAGLLLVDPPARDPSVTRGLVGEPLIPRRGGWGAREISAPLIAPESPEHGNPVEGVATSGMRVRWNLTS